MNETNLQNPQYHSSYHQGSEIKRFIHPRWVDDHISDHFNPVNVGLNLEFADYGVCLAASLKLIRP